MSLSFSDIVGDGDEPDGKPKPPPKASGPLSIYGFDDDAPPAEPAPDQAAAEPSAPPARPAPKAKRPASGIYGFEADPDALSGELAEPAPAGTAAEPAPTAAESFGFNLDPDAVAGELVAEAAREPEAVPPSPDPPVRRRTTTSDRPPPELLAEVAAALSDVDGDEIEDPIAGLPEGSWLDSPAGPGETGAPAEPAEHKPTETVSAADARASRARPAAAAAGAEGGPDWGASTQEIAEELLKAVDAEKRGIASASSEDDLQALLSAALDAPGPDLPKRGRDPEPVPAPDSVPDGDFRAIAAGLIADLEASINPDGSAAADQEASQ